MLDATPTMPVGAATIFTQLPPLPEGTTRPFVTPSAQIATQSNIVFPTGNGGTTPDVAHLNIPPNVATGSPAASEPVASNQVWSAVYSRDPNQPAFLPNSAAYILVDSNGNPITSGTGNLESYNQYYARLGQTPPAPNAPFYGRNILATTSNGTTTYQYVSGSSPQRIAYPYAYNAASPVSFGTLSFVTNGISNNTPDLSTNFGLANAPFPTTPTDLFTLASTARYLDYRTGVGPNGNTPVVVQQMNASGQFQTVASNGLIPYYEYDLPTATPATNDFESDNRTDLAVSMLDLKGAPLAGPYNNPTGIDANDLQLFSYSDNAATFTWGDATLGNFDVTMSESSPFAQFTYMRGTDTNPLALLLRNSNDANNIDTATYYPSLNAIVITGYSKPVNAGMAVVQDPKVLVKTFYAIYLPSGFTITPGTNVASTLDSANLLPGNPPYVPLFGVGANDIVVSIPGQYGTAANPFHFVVAALPNDTQATVAEFRNYAFNYITGSTDTLSLNAQTNQVGLTINVTTQNVDPQSTAMGALLQVYPLQYDNLDPNTYNPQYLPDPLLTGSYLTLATDFGNARLLPAQAAANGDGSDTTSITYSLTYDGSLSILPDGAFDPGGQPTGDRAALQVLIQNFLNNQYPNALLTVNGQGDSYVWGQELQKLTTLIPIAEQVGLTDDARMLLAMVESEMTQWFNASNTLNNDAPGQVLGYDPHFGVPQFFYYDKTWNAMIGYNAGFNADGALNDFMYQYGYWIQAASIVATYDPSFISGYGPMITMIAQNVYNWDRSNTAFPYLRSFDAYAGHSWASGVEPVGNAQNQESISETINFESGMIAWGNALIAAATSPKDPNYALGVRIRNTGIELKTFETASYYEYYLNANNDTFPPITTVSYGGETYGAAGYVTVASYTANPNTPAGWRPEIYASNQFLLRRGTTTFFVSSTPSTGNNAEGHYAITILPFSPSSLYLGADPALVQANYNNYIAQQNSVYGTPVPGQLRAVPITYPMETYIYQAMFDPTDALNRWIGIGGYRWDSSTPLAADSYTAYTFYPSLETPAATYYFMQYFNKYGQVDGGVHALNATQTAVMQQAGAADSNTVFTTYIIENVTSTALSRVTFSDGYVVATVPARSVYAVTVERNTTSGAILSTSSETDAIPDLSGVATGPATGGGTNLFLGYSQPAAPQTATVEPLSLQPQSNPGMVAVTPYTATPSNAFSYQYLYATPVVQDPPNYFFPGQALPQSNTVSFQVQHVNGTYDPRNDTQFQLYFKAPLGVSLMDLLASVQVSYSYVLPDGEASTYTETFPRLTLQGIGGLVVLTDTSLGAIGAYPGVGSGVAAATHTVGKGSIDDGLHFNKYQPSADNQNLLVPPNPTDKDPQLTGRTAQFSPQRFTMTDGTVTFTIFIDRFALNGSAQYANPQLEFFAGLPGYAGFRSFVTIPFNDVSIGKTNTANVGPIGTSARIVSPSPGAIVDYGLDTVTLTADVTADGLPVNEGEVQFLENGTVSLGYAPVVQGVASLAVGQTLGFGNDAITAVYSDQAGRFDPAVTAAEVVEVDAVKVGKGGIKVVAPDGRTRFQVDPYGAHDKKGLDVVGVDPGGGSDPLLIVAPRRGEPPRVRVYDAVTGRQVRSFLAYSRTFRGGVSLAAARPGGKAEIVTAAGHGARPVVKVFDAFTGRQLLRFRAFDSRYRGGTKVSVTDSPDGSGFTIAARTTRDGRTYTSVFDGLDGAPMGESIVAKTSDLRPTRIGRTTLAPAPKAV
jgi:hypothetical protein